MSSADEILKLKELLDNEIITKEEFDKKKKELLNSETKVTSIPTNNTNYNSEKTKKKQSPSISTIVFFIIIFFIVMGMGISQLNSITLQNTTNTNSQSKSTSNNTKYSYTNVIQETILALYPDATFGFVDFRTWQVDGTTYEEGSFTYTNALNQKVKSTYLGRGILGELVYLRIDETVIIRNTDREIELTDKYNSQK